MSTSTNQLNSNVNKRDRNEIICYKCKKPGHFMSKCPENCRDRTQTNNALNAVFLSTKFNKNEWYIDSGASVHLTSKKDWMTDFREERELKEIMVANEVTLPVVGTGNVKLSTIIGQEKIQVEIKNAKYCPGLSTNLLSVSQLINNGNKVVFDGKGCKVFNGQNTLIATAELSDNVYRLDYERAHETVLATLEVWHRRLGHINYSNLNRMKNIVEGLDYKDKCNQQPFC